MDSGQFLQKGRFLSIVEAAPLVSIDLIIQQGGKVLLGKRNNRPAQGYWFVPGGRIVKGEAFGPALERLIKQELRYINLLEDNGIKPEFYGAYQHFYDDCFAGDIGISTHYVVLAHSLTLPDDIVISDHDEQHDEFSWWTIEALLASDIVHQYTKDYFRN